MNDELLIPSDFHVRVLVFQHTDVPVTLPGDDVLPKVPHSKQATQMTEMAIVVGQ